MLKCCEIQWNVAKYCEIFVRSILKYLQYLAVICIVNSLHLKVFCSIWHNYSIFFVIWLFGCSILEHLAEIYNISVSSKFYIILQYLATCCTIWQDCTVFGNSEVFPLLHYICLNLEHLPVFWSVLQFLPNPLIAKLSQYSAIIGCNLYYLVFILMFLKISQ